METTSQIYKSMAKILKEVDFIGKSKTADLGKGGKYNFRGIDDMYNVLHKSFADNQVFIIPEVLETTIETQDKGQDNYGNQKYQYSIIVKVRFTCFAEDGSSVSGIGIGHALDTSDKGTNKAQSSALKYFLMQTFLIPTEEDKDVENNNLSVEKSKNQSKNFNQKPPAEPPKPVKSKNEQIAEDLIKKLENNQIQDLEKTKIWLLENEAKIPANLFKEATDLITQIEKENQPKVEIKFDPNYVN